MLLLLPVYGQNPAVASSDFKIGDQNQLQDEHFVVEEGGERFAWVLTRKLEPRNVLTLFDISRDGKLLRKFNHVELKPYDDGEIVGAFAGGRFVYSVSNLERSERAVFLYDLVRNDSWSFSNREILSEESFRKVDPNHPSRYRKTFGFNNATCEFYINPEIPDESKDQFLPFISFDLIEKTAKELPRPAKLGFSHIRGFDRLKLRASGFRDPDGMKHQRLPYSIDGKGNRQYILSEGETSYKCEQE